MQLSQPRHNPARLDSIKIPSLCTALAGPGLIEPTQPLRAHQCSTESFIFRVSTPPSLIYYVFEIDYVCSLLAIDAGGASSTWVLALVARFRYD